MSDLPAGSVIAGLRIEGVAGRGGMGVVYRAFDDGLQRTVALKVIAEEFAADAEFHERFRQEARSAAGVDHPHVVTVHWAGVERGRLYLVMQYIEGTDLRALISERGRVDPLTTTTLLSQIAGALDAAHAKGLVHRDVKPANVLVAGTAQAPRGYLTDFGLTRPVDASRHITGTGYLVGTEAYMAPELFTGGTASVCSDVYALGCVLFHALAGRVFPRGTGGDRASLRDAVTDPDLAAALDAVVRRALAVDPADRYPSAGALAAAAADAVRDAARGETRAPALPLPITQIGEPTAPAPHPSFPSTPAGPVYLPVSGSATDPGPVGHAWAKPTSVPGSPAVPAGPIYTGPTPPTPGFPYPASPGVPGYSHPAPAGAQPAAPAPRHPGRAAVGVSVLAVLAVIGAGVFALPRLLTSAGGDAPATPPATVVLNPVEDDGSSVKLSWTGPAGLDYGVDIAEEGHDAITQLAGRTTVFTATVDSAHRYCFQVRGTDGRTIVSSNVQPLRGAGCHSG